MNEISGTFLGSGSLDPKYLGVAAFLRPKYRNSLLMKIYKRHSHHVTCLANMADTAR